jgi:hypothetical protein
VHQGVHPIMTTQMVSGWSLAAHRLSGSGRIRRNMALSRSSLITAVHVGRGR